MTARNTQSKLARLRERLVDFCRIRDRGYDVRSDFSPLWVLDQIDMLAEPEGEREELPELQPGGLEIVGLPAGTIRHEVTDRGVLRLVFTPAEEPAPSEAEIGSAISELEDAAIDWHETEPCEAAANEATLEMARDRLMSLWRRAAAPAVHEPALGHAMEILAGTPYTGEMASKVARVLRQWSDKWAAAVDLTCPAPPAPVAPVTDAEVEAAIRAYRSECIAPPDDDACEDEAFGYLRSLIARRVAEARGAGLWELRARLLSTAASFPNRQMGHSDEDFDRGYVEACENWAQEIDRLLAAPPASTTENAKLRELLVWADGWSRDDKHGPEWRSAFSTVAGQIRFLLGESAFAAPPGAGR